MNGQKEERKFTLIERKAIEAAIRAEQAIFDKEMNDWKQVKKEEDKIPPEHIHAIQRELMYLLNLADEAAKQEAETKIKNMAIGLLTDNK